MAEWSTINKNDSPKATKMERYHSILTFDVFIHSIIFNSSIPFSKVQLPRAIDLLQIYWMNFVFVKFAFDSIPGWKIKVYFNKRTLSKENAEKIQRKSKLF